MPLTPTLARPATSVGKISADTPGPTVVQVRCPLSAVTVPAAYFGSVGYGMPRQGAIPPVTTPTAVVLLGEPDALGELPVGLQEARVHSTSTESAPNRSRMTTEGTPRSGEALSGAPNGDVLTVDGADGNLVETTPQGAQVAMKVLDSSGNPPGLLH